MHQIFIKQRWLSTLYSSSCTFSHPLLKVVPLSMQLNHSFMFSINVTNLMVNFSQFNVYLKKQLTDPILQETGVLIFIKTLETLTMIYALFKCLKTNQPTLFYNILNTALQQQYLEMDRTFWICLVLLFLGDFLC